MSADVQNRATAWLKSGTKADGKKWGQKIKPLKRFENGVGGVWPTLLKRGVNEKERGREKTRTRKGAGDRT
jgi:hypothetical protein